MADPVLLGFVKVVNKPLNDLYEYLKHEVKFHLEKKKLNEIDERLSLKIENIKKVKTIYKGDEAIDLNSFFFPPQIIIDHKLIKADCVADISDKNIVIEGVAGQGKSILLRYLTYKEYELMERIPIFIELRKINKDGEILNFIKEVIGDWVFSISDEYLDWVLKSGKIVLILDGFDELQEKDVSNVIKDLESISQKYNNTQIVVSSRPDNHIQNSNFFKVINIQEYGDNEQKGLIKKLVEDNDSFKNIVNAIDASKLNISELLSTPLMITLFVMTYRAKLTIPDSMSKFYQELFSVLIYKHDRTKPGFQREFKCTLNENTLQDWFEIFCFISKNKKLLTFVSRNILLDCIRESVGKKYSSENPSNLLEDISKNLCLIIRDGNSYNFIHRSIQEFFVASFIKNRPEDLSEKTYKLLNEKCSLYEAEIKFLLEIDTYRYMKYLLKPNLEIFFKIFPNFDGFLNSLHVRIISTFHPGEDHYSGDLKDMVENKIGGFYIVEPLNILSQMKRKYIYYLLHSKFFEGDLVDDTFVILNDYNFNRFSLSLSILEEDIKVEKITKYFRKEAKDKIKYIYDDFLNSLAAANKLIEEKEDNSFLDLM
jgi:NACHT domain